MRRTPGALLLAAALATLAAHPARAQDPTPIRVGQPVSGSLASGDPTLTERGRFKVYRFDARKGQHLVATLRSADFDAYLTLARSVGGVTDAIKTDDDRGGGDKGTDARIRFTVPDDGTYLLLAQALAEDGLGAYTLSLEPAPTPTTAQSRELRPGQTVNGALAETDAVLEDDDTYYDTYVVSGRAGQRLVIEMKSDAFDTFLAFGRMEGEAFNSTKTDDDGGENTNSVIRVTLPEAGEYIVRANSMGAGQTGAYTISVSERAPAPPASPRPIAAGQEVDGTLDDDDPVLEDESFYDYWTYTGRAGEKLRITMKSTEFDTFLALGRLTGDTFAELVNNDDGGDDGTNSQIEFTLPEAGTYVIRANSLGGGATGPYKLHVERQP